MQAQIMMFVCICIHLIASAMRHMHININLTHWQYAVAIGGFCYGPLGQETPVSQAPKMLSVEK